jgi:hypothetical protein
MGIGAKDQTNYLVAGSGRNVSQDSGACTGACSREDVDFVNKLRMCVDAASNPASFSDGALVGRLW